MGNFAIRAEKVSKRYRIEAGQRARRMKSKMLRDRIQDSFVSAARKLSTLSFGGQKRPDPNFIWALEDVDFEIEHGESMGIIGPNGAGKTTLLKILARITAPTRGRVRMRGRVGSLLEVGTGFHSELTGRENVYLNGAILGMRMKEIDRKFDEIVDFSGVEAFIDTPVKRYSSGMRMRLAFSVAAHLEPEILLVDEVLAVGDIAFQNKSLDKMEKVTHEGRTILFVSHNLAAVKSLCPRAIFLDHGCMRFMGSTETAIQMYLQGKESAAANEDVVFKPRKNVQIMGLQTCRIDGSRLQSFPHDQPVYVRIKVYLNTTAFKTHLVLKIYNSNLDVLLVSNDFEPDGDSLIPASPGTYDFQIEIPADFLAPGKYYLGAEVARQVSNNRMRPVHKLDHSAQFDVYDNGSLFSQLNVPWRGWVHPRLEWTRIGQVSET
jgi:lipopolysaccharide transport system ATP-binding protein